MIRLIEDLQINDIIQIGTHAYRVTGIKRERVWGEKVAEHGIVVSSKHGQELDCRLNGWTRIYSSKLGY